MSYSIPVVKRRVVCRNNPVLQNRLAISSVTQRRYRRFRERRNPLQSRVRSPLPIIEPIDLSFDLESLLAAEDLPVSSIPNQELSNPDDGSDSVAASLDTATDDGPMWSPAMEDIPWDLLNDILDRPPLVGNEQLLDSLVLPDPLATLRELNTPVIEVQRAPSQVALDLSTRPQFIVPQDVAPIAPTYDQLKIIADRVSSYAHLRALRMAIEDWYRVRYQFDPLDLFPTWREISFHTEYEVRSRVYEARFNHYPDDETDFWTPLFPGSTGEPTLWTLCR
jgi:hypothetical protein